MSSEARGVVVRLCEDGAAVGCVSALTARSADQVSAHLASTRTAHVLAVQLRDSLHSGLVLCVSSYLTNVSSSSPCIGSTRRGTREPASSSPSGRAASVVERTIVTRRLDGTHVRSHILEPCEQLLVCPVDLESFAGVFCQRAQDDQRSKLGVDIAILELLADGSARFLSDQRRSWLLCLAEKGGSIV